ncbi:ABC transporter ATP-binding protein [Butyrivibrio sp. XB500-5]|uniref:ABC transporter ATP-binding protein n=1 Tax=Butyrivibrio sp. XB500-5 TaxID=2364880 RepID=UPI000EA988E9|nr:ABC transporter ATP-binding protein [Butyrivibrio sp. XB500-5]RKM60902.1 ABC transporter ATP-binding protein [Butyrivibrio sp. XB500-5]
MIATLRRFFKFCSEKNRKRFYIALVLSIVAALCGAMKFPAMGYILMNFINGTIDKKTILIGFLIMTVPLALEATLKGFSTMLQCRGGYGECADKRIHIAEHLRFIPMGYFNENSLGQITSVTTNTMEALGDVATRVVMVTTQGILGTSVIMLLIFIFDYRIGLISLAGIIIYAFINYAMRKHGEKISARKIVADSTLVANIIEYVQGIPEVKAYNLIGNARKKLNNSIDEAANVCTDLEISANSFVPYERGVLKITGVAITLASCIFYINGSMDLVTAIIMMIMSFQVFEGLEATGSFSALLRIVDMSVARANEILAIKPMDIEGDDIVADNSDIDVNDIDFAYDEKKIIDDIALSIPSGTSAAFVGPSGGGKTTLCHLIARFWDVDKGRVELDGKDVRKYSMNSLMSNYSFVFQNVFLFHDTIANNIRFGNPDAPLEEVIKAAKKACCHDFIMALPEGYDTVIGENGASLSGGERQRISIARAIMKDAPIIILDEATANVDPENEKELMTAIKELTKEKTILMIAHRLKTVKNADQIFVVDQGKIVQRGKHSELAAQDGIYKRFIDSRRQAVGWKIS